MRFFEHPTPAFVPVEYRTSQDELIQGIENANREQDNEWDLASSIDPDQLQQTWETIVEDIHGDPGWASQSID